MTTAHDDRKCASNEGAEEPARVAVKALIYSEHLRPIDISSQLGLQPTKVAEKGVTFGPRTGTPMNIPRHMWCLSSEPHVSARDLSSHLDWLLGKLVPIREQLLALRRSETIRCELRGVVWTNGTPADVRIETHQMETLVALQLPLQPQFADYGNDE